MDTDIASVDINKVRTEAEKAQFIISTAKDMIISGKFPMPDSRDKYADEAEREFMVRFKNLVDFLDRLYDTIAVDKNILISIKPKK
ncbi:hypothetical protein MCHI_001523 [Candidatus Magnetoovum chiemensis]|nr:hypothetical protein MCHI_001523 [Candidatus Magnetoovum chiemensis]